MVAASKCDGWSLTQSGQRYALRCPYFEGAVAFRLATLVSFRKASARIREQRGVQLPPSLRVGWLNRVLRLVCQAGQEAAA